MKNAIIKAKMAIGRSEANINDARVMLYLWGREEALSGLDETLLDNLLVILESVQKELDVAGRFLEGTIGLPPAPEARCFESDNIREFKKAS